MNLDTKVEVSVGCLNYLTGEVESLRKQNRELVIKVELTDRFLRLTESIQPRGNNTGFGPDLLWQAKQEIEKAVETAKAKVDVSSPKEEVAS